jgi:ribonuclease P/MRP protein subunit RPP40
MSFNLGKCKVMHVGTHNPAYEYFMRGGVRLEETEEERDIGVAVAKNLKPSAQCSKAAGRASPVLGQLRRNFHYKDRYTFLRFYKQYVRPHLEFSAPAWSPWLQGDKDTLERVQEKAVKMVASLKGANYLEKCAELGLETLEKRREDQDLALVYKFVTKWADLVKSAGRCENQAGSWRAWTDSTVRPDRPKKIFICYEDCRELEQVARESENS